MSDFLMNNYSPLPVEFVKGTGSWLIDSKGEKYLDALSGIAVCGLGHSHPSISKIITEQSATLIHTSNIYRIPFQEQLAKKLTNHSEMDRAFFCNSGAEANEAAIKLARLHAHNQKVDDSAIIVMENSFHGRTMGTISASGKRVRDGFKPLLGGFIHAPFNNIEALGAILKVSKNVVAIMVEPIQGEGGIIVPDHGYLKAIRDLCDQNNLLMIVDEVQTGMCRTGKWFAFQHESILPDVITIAKALGNGVPIGACLARGRAAELFKAGSHGSTFGGNPFASRVALEVVNLLEKEEMDQQVAKLGIYFLKKLKESLQGMKGVIDIRGKGLMMGIELEKDCLNLVAKALERKLLINVTSSNVIRLLPPLIMKESEADEVVLILTDILKKHLLHAH
ncbi:MAG: aspartate aminotransferase family protein [Gammaproteobacteria bacterium]